MKFVPIVVMSILVLAGQAHGADQSPLKTSKDKLSYTFRANFGVPGTMVLNQGEASWRLTPDDV